MSETLVVAFVVGVTPGKWARTWAERMPRHPLDLRPMSADAAMAQLHSGEVHAALLRLPVVDERLSAIPLYTEQPVVVLPHDHALSTRDALTLAELADISLFSGDEASTGTETSTGTEASTGNATTPANEVWAAAVELVATGAGGAIMPQSVARALSRRDVVARLVTDAPTTRMALAWVTERSTAELEEFIGIVRGRTANSSRGTAAEEHTAASKAPEKPVQRPKKVRPKNAKGPTPAKKYRRS